MSSAVARAREVRARLMDPPNAVPDTVITVKDGRLISGVPVKAPAKPVQRFFIVDPLEQSKAEKRRQRWREAKQRRKQSVRYVPLDCRWTTLIGGEPRIPIPETTVTSRHIITAVCKVWDIQPAIIVGDRREIWAVNPRHVAIAICRHLTKLSTLELGRIFGGRNHSTIIHAQRRMQPHIDKVALTLAPIEEWVTNPELYSRSPLDWAMAMKTVLK
jgi:hypothetical protein